MAVVKTSPGRPMTRTRTDVQHPFRGTDMTFFRDLSVRWKLFGGFGAVLALTAIIGAVLIGQLGSVNRGGAVIDQNYLPTMDTLGQVKADVIDYRQAQLR